MMHTDKDCRFDCDGRRFQLRAGAVIIEENCILLAKNDAADYYYSVGGAVKLGETAEDAVKREVLEETGIEYEVDRLLFVHENFFVDESVQKGIEFHEISFYFLMKPQGKKKITAESYCFCGREYMNWVPLEKLADSQVYPVYFKDRLMKLPQEIEHIITDEINQSGI